MSISSGNMNNSTISSKMAETAYSMVSKLARLVESWSSLSMQMSRADCELAVLAKMMNLTVQGMALMLLRH
jgi:hypothetical protein